MHLPDTNMEVRRSTKHGYSNSIVANSKFNGFELRLAPTMMTHCLMLADVYEMGKERIEMIAAEYPTDAGAPVSKVAPVEEVTINSSAKDTSLKVSVSCEFSSGTVLFLKSDQEIAEITEQRAYERRGSRPATADTLRLPSISLWTTYERVTNGLMKDKKTCQIFFVSQ